MTRPSVAPASRVLSAVASAAVLLAATFAGGPAFASARSILVSPDKVSPQPAGTTVTFTATASGGTAPYEYRFFLKGDSTNWQYVEMQPYSTADSWAWDTTGIIGNHKLQVYAREAGSNRKWEARTWKTFRIMEATPTDPTTPPYVGLSLSSDQPSPQVSGTVLTFTAAGPGGPGDHQYQFWYRGAATGGQWTPTQAYSTQTAWTWDTAGREGAWEVGVSTRLVGASGYDETAIVAMQLDPPPADAPPPPPYVGLSLSSDQPSPQVSGTSVTFTVSGPGGAGDHEYAFWYRGDVTNNQWTVAQAFSSAMTWTWDTTGEEGSYEVGAVTRQVGTSGYDELVTLAYVLDPPPAPAPSPSPSPTPPYVGLSLSTDLASPQASGAQVTFTAAGPGGAGEQEYQFWYRGAVTNNQWTPTQSYSPQMQWTWDTTGYDGSFDVAATSRTVGSTQTYEEVATLPYMLDPASSPSDPPPPSDPPAGNVIFTSDFEWAYNSPTDARAHGWAYEDVKNNGRQPGGAMISTSTAVAASGGRALKCEVPDLDPSTVSAEGATQKSMLGYKGTGLPVGRGKVITLAAQYYIPSSSTGRITIFDVEDNQNGNIGCRFQIEDGRVTFNRDKLRISPYTFKEYATIPKNRWFEAKVELTPGEGTAGHVRFWIDGNLVMDVHTDTIVPQITSYTTIQAGITARLDTAYLMYMDDFTFALADVGATTTTTSAQTVTASTSTSTSTTTTSPTYATTSTTTTSTTSSDPAATDSGGGSGSGDTGGVLVTAPAEQHAIADLAIEPRDSLGLAFPGDDPADYALVAGAGIGVVRLNVSWADVEPAPGRYDWAALDAKVIALQRDGMEPLLTLFSDAEWATDPNTATAKNRTPLRMATWATFVHAVAERYDADGLEDAAGLRHPVRHFQVANEWLSATNASGGWASSKDVLIVYVNAAHDAVKAANANAVFVMGGIASLNLDVMVLHEGLADYTARQRWADGREVVITPEMAASPVYDPIIAEVYRVLETCRYDYADVHLYGPVEHDPYKIFLIGQHTDGRPLVSTECGGPSLDYSTYTPAAHFLGVFERNLTTLGHGLPFVQWFQLVEGPSTWGNQRVALMDATYAPKPGYRAYQLLSALLRDMERVEVLAPGQFLVHRSGGQSSLFVAWRTAQGPDSVSLGGVYTGAALLRVTDATAGTYTITTHDGGPVSLTELPLVLGNLPSGL